MFSFTRHSCPAQGKNERSRSRGSKDTSSRMLGSAFSSVEYAKDTPVRLGRGVAEGVAPSDSNTSEGGPEAGAEPACKVMHNSDRGQQTMYLGHSLEMPEQKHKLFQRNIKVFRNFDGISIVLHHACRLRIDEKGQIPKYHSFMKVVLHS